MTLTPSTDDCPKPRDARRCAFATVVLAGTVVIVVAAVAGRCFTWNLSPSLPRGLYLLERGEAAERGSIVVFPVPEAARPIVVARGYLPADARLLKVVVAVPGDAACVLDDALIISRRTFGHVRPRDSLGRPLPAAHFCGELPAGVALVATPAPLSFDSRYFGPVPLSALTVVRPVWTF